MSGTMIRRLAAFLALFALGSLNAHAQTSESGRYPSLAKRPAESRDRQPPEPAPVQPASVDAALATQVSQLAEKASGADAAFRKQLDQGRSLVSAARNAAPESEAWVAAQMAVSALDGARYESIAALASLDTLHVERQNNEDSGRVMADLATIDPVRMQVLALVDAQNDALDSLRGALRQP
ncbi:hypothetical protein SLG_00960 [Sphingobium sp. SYK-6]|uniref:hypothetical protein n=1 Tax=Sphingobium sp. (strain NBRC 103272 / SYK-6) TaxID=627192 RepID=UPI0002276A2B|nr:hypothetical protein [Sphingobium sp. SYK-6]BAK64771.1 hypothetical protein SLG_00960 [Sphingobium sp. SYK-6]